MDLLMKTKNLKETFALKICINFSFLLKNTIFSVILLTSNKLEVIKMTKKSALSVVICILCAFLIFSLSACSKQEEEPTTTESTTVATTTQATTKAEPKGNINNLTGKYNLSDSAVGKRPVAIMINNIKAALPQYGIYSADIMFETLVEGGITRMMALYSDYTKVPKVCSVRSCRYYYPILAHGFDAVYFCFGSNESLGTPTLKRIGIDYFDGNQTYDTLVFGRDPDRLRKYSREHTAFVNGAGIPDLLKKYSVRTDYAEGKNSTAFKFRDEKTKKAVGDTKADKVRLNFSTSYYSTFTYDKEKKVYCKTHCANAHMDTSNNKQLNYTNVFVLETTFSNYKNSAILEMNWKGGTGYYISCGKAQPILWEKTSESNQIKYYNASTGEELLVNTGKSYIGILRKDCTVISAAE